MEDDSADISGNNLESNIGKEAQTDAEDVKVCGQSTADAGISQSLNMDISGKFEPVKEVILAKSSTNEEGCSHSESNGQHDSSNKGNIDDSCGAVRQQEILHEKKCLSAAQEKESLQNKITNLSELVNIQRKEIQLLEKDKEQQLTNLREAEMERDQYKVAKVESDEKIELLLRQKGEFEARIRNLICEKNQFSAEVETMKCELKKYVEKNAVLESSIDEMRKNKFLSKLEKEHWMQERDLYLHNKTWFLKEIRGRDSKLNILKVESIRSDGELQAERASLSECCENLKNELATARKEVAEKDAVITMLNRRMNEAMQEASDKCKRLQCEVANSQQLIKVSEEASKQMNCQLEKLQRELADRNRLLDETKKENELLHSKFDTESRQHKEIITQQENTIKELRDEALKTSKLLKSEHRLPLTDQEVSDLSPAAAAASALIKNGTSLTEIYRQHCHTVAKLEAVELEKTRLEEYVNQFVDVLEEKAPLLVQQRFEYERLNKSYSALREQLQNADDERQRLVAARDSSSRELAYTKTELEKAQRDNDDLAKQVRHLLYSIESKNSDISRNSYTTASNSDTLWSSIIELQQANQKLMSDLKSVKANHEQIIQETNQAEINRLNETINDTHRKVHLLKLQNDKQELIIKQLQEQRDTYKRLIEEKTAKENITTENALNETKARVSDLESKLRHYENCLKICREEKLMSDQVLNDRIEQQFKLITQLRKANAKLENSVCIAKQNDVFISEKSYKTTEIELVKMRCDKAESARTTLENRLHDTEVHLLESKAEVGQLKSQLSLLEEKVEFFRLSESQLREEISGLRESNYSNEKMTVTLQQLQNRCEKLDEVKQKRQEEQINVMKNENQALKNYINEITEKHRIVVFDLKMECVNVEKERDKALTDKKLVEEKLNGKNEECEKLQAHYDSLVKQSELLAISPGDRISECKMETQDLLSKNVFLEDELRKMRNSLEAAELKLTLKEEEIEGLKKLNDNSQSASVGQSINNDFSIKCLKSTLQVISKQLDDSMNTITELRTQNLKLEQQLNVKLMRAEEIHVEGQRKILDFEKKLIGAECSQKVAELNADCVLRRSKEMELKIKDLTSDKEKLTDEIKTMEDKLQKNFQLLKVAEIAKLEDEAKTQDLRRNYQNEIAKLKLECKRLENELEEFHQLTVPQRNRIQRFITILNKLGVTSEQLLEYKELLEQQEDATEITEEEADNDPLKSIIKLLNDENQESMTRMMSAEVQKKHLEKRISFLEESRSNLEEEIKSLQLNAEVGARALSENKTLTARLSHLDDLKRENDIMKKRCEELTLQKENMLKKVTELESCIQALQSEKTKDKYHLECNVVDLQNYRKEAESWKERHSEAMAALNKIGPEKVVSLTGELDATKRHLASLSTELENSRSQTEEINSEHKAETEKLNITIHQLRVLAKNYKAKYLALNGERETLQKELSDLKLRGEAGSLQPENSEQTDSVELNNLRQQLLAARHETEKLKQGRFKLVSNMPRASWPVDAMVGSPSSSKGPSVLQAQMKQIESLNCLNKDLKGQLELLATRLKTSQDDLVVAKGKIDELEKEKETVLKEKESKEEELRFRLNSITSMMTKKDSEISKLKVELEELKKELTEANGKICILQSALEETQTKKADDNSDLPCMLKTSCVSESASTISISSQVKPANSTVVHGSNEVPRVPSASFTSEYDRNAEELCSVSVPEETKLDGDDSTVSYAKISPSVQQETTSNKSNSSLTLKQPSVSTTSEKQPSAANTAGVVVTAVSVGGPNYVEPESVSGSESQVNELCKGSQLCEKNVLNSDTSMVNRAYQSCTVSQSSGINIPTGCRSMSQHNESTDKSGSGDEVNVISSSGVNNPGTSAGFSDSATAEATFSSCFRKRPISSTNDQLSSVESGSELQETVKRQRITISEQVSTSSRSLQQNVEIKLKKEQTAAIEEDCADPEQQENVETTTSPEDEVVDDGYSMRKERTAMMHRHAGDIFGNQKDDEGDEEFQRLGQKDRDEEAPGEDEQDREEEYLDEALGAGEEEYKDEIEDYEDYEDEGDDEGVEEEVPDIHSHRPLLTTSRLLSHHQQNDNEEGKASHSQSPADQSTDEADEGPRTSAYHADTSIERNRAKKEIDAANEDEMDVHQKLQQTRRVIYPDRSIPESKGARNECPKAPAIAGGTMELTRADTTAHCVNVESDGRGSSTANETASESRSNIKIVRSALDDEEGDNEVAEEEHCTKLDFRNRTGQTDDETGLSEPSTSGEFRQRRTRILYPDVNEPSSSSSDRPRGSARSVRGASPYKLRRVQLRRRP